MASQEELQCAFRAYQQAHGGEAHGTDVVCAWAVENGLLVLPAIDPLGVLSSSMAQALRNEFGTDPETGRRYRMNHARRVTRRGVQLGWVWAALETAPREHMQEAFQQRRRQIVTDCVQLRVDVDVYNARNRDQEPIQMVLDFTHDVDEHFAAEEDAEDAA